MKLEEITPRQFEMYLLLVETAAPYEVIAARLGMSNNAARQLAGTLFNLLGVSTRVDLMVQYHSRERAATAKKKPDELRIEYWSPVILPSAVQLPGKEQ